MRASLMTLVGAATVLAASLTGASAQVLNLTGQFQCVRLCLATPPAFAYLTQADWELNLVNEAAFRRVPGSTIRVTSGWRLGTRARSIRPMA